MLVFFYLNEYTRKKRGRIFHIKIRSDSSWWIWSIGKLKRWISRQIEWICTFMANKHWLMIGGGGSGDQIHLFQSIDSNNTTQPSVWNQCWKVIITYSKWKTHCLCFDGVIAIVHLMIYSQRNWRRHGYEFYR